MWRLFFRRAKADLHSKIFTNIIVFVAIFTAAVPSEPQNYRKRSHSWRHAANAVTSVIWQTFQFQLQWRYHLRLENTENLIYYGAFNLCRSQWNLIGTLAYCGEGRSCAKFVNDCMGAAARLMCENCAQKFPFFPNAFWPITAQMRMG